MATQVSDKKDVAVEPAVRAAQYGTELIADGYRLETMNADQAGFKTTEGFSVYGKALGGGKVRILIPSTVKLNLEGNPICAKMEVDLAAVMDSLAPAIRAVAKANAETLGIKFEKPEKGSRGKGSKYTLE